MQAGLLISQKEDLHQGLGTIKYLNQELAHQCDVRNCLADKISSTFGSNLVIYLLSRLTSSAHVTIKYDIWI